MDFTNKFNQSDRSGIPPTNPVNAEDVAAGAPIKAEPIDGSAVVSSFQGQLPLLKDVIRVVLCECPRLMGDIRKAVTNGDAAALKLSAHTLKGSVRSFGETTVHHRAYTLEMMGRDENLSDADAAVVDLESALKEFLPALQELMDKIDVSTKAQP